MSRIVDILRAAAAMLRTVQRGAAEAAHAAARALVNLGYSVMLGERVRLAGWYSAECLDADGRVLWRRRWPNLVTTAGKNHLLDTEMAGSAYTAAWYLGLISSTSYSAVAAGDTMASHAGWTESTAYSNSTRVAVSWSAASSGTKASTTCTFNINATDTIKGAFLTTGSAKGGTTGTLYSAGLFTGGDQPVVNTNTLNVTYTASA